MLHTRSPWNVVFSKVTQHTTESCKITVRGSGLAWYNSAHFYYYLLALTLHSVMEHLSKALPYRAALWSGPTAWRTEGPLSLARRSATGRACHEQHAPRLQHIAEHFALAAQAIQDL